MDATQVGQWVSTILIVGGFVVYVISRFKRQPEEKAKTEVTVAQATLDIVHNSVELVTGEYEEQFQRMSNQLRDEREQHEKEREELRLLHAKQIEEERAAGMRIKQQMDALIDDATKLRADLRDAQRECDRWKQKYEEEAAKNRA